MPTTTDTIPDVLKRAGFERKTYGKETRYEHPDGHKVIVRRSPMHTSYQIARTQTFLSFASEATRIIGRLVSKDLRTEEQLALPDFVKNIANSLPDCSAKITGVKSAIVDFGGHRFRITPYLGK